MSLQILAIIAAVFHLLGIASAVQAIMETRTPQGAVAWVLGLITFPYVAVPAIGYLAAASFAALWPCAVPIWSRPFPRPAATWTN